MVTIFFVNRYSSSKSAYSVSTQTQQPYNLKKWRLSLIQSIIYISHVTYDVIIKKVCLRGSWEGEDQSNIHRVWRVSVHKQSTRKKQKDTLKPDQKNWTRTSLKETREKHKGLTWNWKSTSIKLQVTRPGEMKWTSQELLTSAKHQVIWWWILTGSGPLSLAFFGSSGAYMKENEQVVWSYRYKR